MSNKVSETVALHREHGRVACITIAHPPVNALSHSVRHGLVTAVQQVVDDANISAAIIVCEGKIFSAGADVKELGKPMQAPELAEVLATIENADKPIIAAMHSKVLGGGLELALACHYRIATSDATFALPEINLGIIPGCGGTQRLPRVAGLDTTIALAAEGRSLAAPQALEVHLLDAVEDHDLAAKATAFAEQLVADGKGPRPTRTLAMPDRDEPLIEEARAKLAKRCRLEPAPRAVLEAIDWGYECNFEDALKREYEKCVELLNGPESRAMRHLFTAEKAVKRLPEGATPRLVKNVAVVGPGGMGCGIAAVFAQAGYPVMLCGRDAEHAAKGQAKVEKILASLVKRKRMTEQQHTQAMQRITPANLDAQALADVDLAIEAVSENMELKQKIFAQLGQLTKPSAILASNTSYLDINVLGQAAGRPADVCGMHFFTPAHLMRLLENVRGDKTAADVVATITSIAPRIGKIPVLAGVGEGFIVNRLLGKRSREGYFLLEDGARPPQIDRVLTQFGFPLGLYTLSDLAGIDLQYAARQARLAGMSKREVAADFVDQLYALGRYGQKTGAGWYVYGDDRKPQPDPAIDKLLDEHAARRGIVQRSFDDDEILQRTLFAMVNEAANILEQGLASSPQDIDIAMVHGVGFPKTTGGPLWWAGEIGLGKVRATMQHFADTVGAEFWTPNPLIERLADAGKTFYDN